MDDKKDNSQNKLNRVHNDSKALPKKLNNNLARGKNFYPKNNSFNNQIQNDISNDKLKNKSSIGKISDNSKNNTLNKASKVLNKMGPKGKIASKALDGIQKASNLRKKNSDENVPSALKNKEHQGLKNRFLNRLSGNSEESSSHEEDSNYSDESDSAVENNLLGKDSTKFLLMKMLPVLLPIAGGALVIILFIVLLSDPIATISNFIGVHSHGTENSIYSYNEGNKEMLEAEKKYNEKLAETIQKYEYDYGVTLDKYLLHAAVSYRYYTKGVSDLYTSDSGITDEDLPQDDINSSTEDGSSSTEESQPIVIDYTAATKKIAVVAKLMVEKNGDFYTTNFVREGIFYNNLLNSRFLETYYKGFFVSSNEESRKKLVDEIFDFADLAKELLIEPLNNSFVSDQIAVNLQTCVPTYNFTEINGLKVYNNPLTNEGTSYPTSLKMIDYIKGVLMSELSVEWFTEDLKEMIKTQAILALTFIIGDKESGFDLKNGQMYFPTATCRQVTCDPTHGCISVSGVASYTGLDRNFSGRKIKPLTPEQNAYLDQIMNEIFGIVIAKPGVTAETFAGSSSIKSINYCSDLYNVCSSCRVGSCVGQNDAKKDALAGMTYEEILDKYIDSDFELVNIKEGLYFTTDGNYNGTIQLNEEFHYHQGDSPWGSQTLCGSGSISKNGCNITSVSMAISLLKNQKITPTMLNNRQNEIGTCRSGSRPQMIRDFAKMYGLTAVEVKKDDSQAVNDMLAKLATGNYVAVARLAPNSGRYRTKSGHYITVVGVKTENGKVKLLIWDPGSKSSSRDNYWADINNDILKYLRDSYSFILIGRN